MSLVSRVVGICGDSTHVVLIPGHLEISLISPLGAPAVLDQPEVLPSLRAVAVANRQHCVV